MVQDSGVSGIRFSLEVGGVGVQGLGLGCPVPTVYNFGFRGCSRNAYVSSLNDSINSKNPTLNSSPLWV